jgi:hypothetical protein
MSKDSGNSLMGAACLCTTDVRRTIEVMATSHLDSWMRSLFSETRKTISNINIPVLIVQ